MSKKPTISDVAREANVSKATVSYVLNGKRTNLSLSDATIARVLAVCAQLGYAPDETAVALSARRSRPVRMLVVSPWLYARHSDFMAQMHEAFEALTRERGLDVTFTPYKDGALLKALRPALAKKYDAVLLIGTCPSDEQALARHAAEYEGKLIVLNRLIESPFISSVYGNDYDAEYALASSIVASGHYSSYVIINEGGSSRCRRERFRALHDALPAERTEELQITERLDISRLPAAFPQNTCLFFITYDTAARFLTDRFHAGVAIPEQCGVASYDVHTLLEAFLPLPMTTIDPRVGDMVRAAYDIAAELKEGGAPSRRLIEARLVYGGSTIFQKDE